MMEDSGLVQDDEAISPKHAGFPWSGTGKLSSTNDEHSSGSGDEDSQQNATGDGKSDGRGPVGPVQKRRRVTRACDECRRKKIKCDGKQPCTHCTVYSYDCTYDQPSNRRRNPTPQYIENLEKRMNRAEALLKTYAPDVDIDDPSLVVSESPTVHFPQPGYEKNAGLKPPTSSSNRHIKQENGISEADGKDSMLESMVQRTGSLDIDDRGHWDYYGHSSSLVFLKRLKQQFGDLMGEAEGHGTVFTRAASYNSAMFDSPRLGSVSTASMGADSPMDAGTPNSPELPAKALALQLCEVALTDALALMRFIHQPTFYAIFNRIFDTPRETWGNDENRHLPLVYALMAVGSMFGKTENSVLETEGYENALEYGFKYFRTARSLMEVTDCRDLPSLQALICMIVFLQSSAKLATCYSYIGIALHSAIRMGLHRSIQGNFNPIEREIRKRIFWQIRKLDIYVGAMLGLPIMLSDDDIDQELSAEIDDEYILPDRVLPQPPNKFPMMKAANTHLKLVRILQKVVKNIYPTKGMQGNLAASPQTTIVSHSKIREIEKELQMWMEELPDELKPGDNKHPELVRIQQLLRIAYAHIQLFLYRPFLHYTARSVHPGHVDKRSYACAAACVSVSRNTVHITCEMSKKGLLVGSYWFVMYTTFMAVMTLVFFVFENPDNTSSKDILRDAYEGKELLAKMAKRSMAADRCNQTLKGLFSQVDKIKRGSISAVSRKRHASPDARAEIAKPKTWYEKTANARSQAQARAASLPNQAALQQWQRGQRLGLSTNVNDSPPSAGNVKLDVYSPNSDNMAGGILTPDSNASANGTANGMYKGNVNGNGVMNNMPSPSAFFSNATGFNDLSEIMFPSNDPFAYPNQPMSSLEDAGLDSAIDQMQGFFSQSSTPSRGRNNTVNGAGSMFDEGSNGSNGAGGGGSTDAQIFGLMPPYLMQGQQPGLHMNLDLGAFSMPQQQQQGLRQDAWPGSQGNDDGWGEGTGFYGV